MCSCAAWFWKSAAVLCCCSESRLQTIICVKFTRLRRWSECTVYTQQVFLNWFLRKYIPVWCTRVLLSFLLPHHGDRFPVAECLKMEQRMGNDNGKWEWKMWNENEDVFLRPQSLFIWKRNCSSAQWNVRCSPGLPFNCAYCNFGAVPVL